MTSSVEAGVFFLDKPLLQAEDFFVINYKNL